MEIPAKKAPYIIESNKRRVNYFYLIAKKLGVSKEFVDNLLEEEKNKTDSKRFDIGRKIREKSGKTITRKLGARDGKFTIKLNKDKLPVHKQKCTSGISHQCLDTFITNNEDTVCLRCKNCG